MLKLTPFLAKLYSTPYPKCHITTSTVCRDKEKWDLMTALCIERRPIIAPLPTQLEVEYQKMLSEIEFERSLKSDHEMRHEKELQQLEQLKKGDDVDVHIKQTAQDLVDAAVEELNQFKLGDRITEADKKNDLRSLRRKLDKSLVLLVKQKLGKDDFYLLPQGLRQDGETLREAADRVLKQTCGDSLVASVYGNAPSGFYKFKYPKTIRETNGITGAKVFIYFARYQKGQLDETTDYKWLDQKELDGTLSGDYRTRVTEMLIDED